MINLYKRLGETPLEATERFREANPSYKGVPMTYAGRLDPMAEGVLIILSGDENKDRQRYISLDKEYEFEFILGLRTDTYDVLGLLEPASVAFLEPQNESIESIFKKYKGVFEQRYPPFSSKILNGEPLFLLARQGKLVGKTLPTHRVSVNDSVLLPSRMLGREELRQTIISSIKLVKGDFRQSEIEKRWQKYFSETERTEFVVHKARISCDSGFYVRELVHSIGQELGVGSVTFSILRNRVGQYTIGESTR